MPIFQEFGQIDTNAFNSIQTAFYEFSLSYDEITEIGLSFLSDPNRPWLLEAILRQDAVCPLGHTCISAGDSRGMFVRDLADEKIYFSELGWQRYNEGANIDWTGVARDLLIILAGSVGGAGGLLAAVSQMLGMTGWGISLFHDNPPPR